MLNRKTAPTFIVPYGFDNISQPLMQLLENTYEVQPANYCIDYNKRNILWMPPENMDDILQEPLFWSAIINQEIRIYKNVAFKIKIPNDGTQTTNLSKDGNYYYVTITDTSLLSSDGNLMTTNPDLVYLTNQDYNDNFKEEIIDEFLEGEI